MPLLLSLLCAPCLFFHDNPPIAADSVRELEPCASGPAAGENGKGLMKGAGHTETAVVGPGRSRSVASSSASDAA